jgi:hypothetical protein
MGKDKNKPKRGLSAFMYYSQERRPAVKKSKPDIKFGEIAKVIGAEWKDMKESAKAKYQKLAVKDKARYEKEMETYVAPPDDGKGKKKRKKKDPNAPKRPKSSYMCFAVARRPELVKANPNWDFGKFEKTIGEEWRSMSASKKAKYEKLAVADKSRYVKEMSAYAAK